MAGLVNLVSRRYYHVGCPEGGIPDTLGVLGLVVRRAGHIPGPTRVRRRSDAWHSIAERAKIQQNFPLKQAHYAAK